MDALFIYLYISSCCVCVCVPSVHGCVWKSEDSWGVLTQLVLILLTVSLTGTQDSMIRLNWLASETPRESSCLKLLNAVVLEMELRSLCLSGKHFIDQTLQTAPVYFFLTLKLLIDWLIDWFSDWLADWRGDVWMSQCACGGQRVIFRSCSPLSTLLRSHFPSSHRSAGIANAALSSF